MPSDLNSPNLGPSLVRGPRQWPNWPKPRAGPNDKIFFYESFLTRM